MKEEENREYIKRNYEREEKRVNHVGGKRITIKILKKNK